MFENFVRQFLLLSEIGVKVVRSFLESKYQPDDFETFLENNKTTIYHLNDNRKSGCCTCVNLPRHQIIRKEQFDKLYTTNGQNCPKPAPKCHCKFMANPGIQLADIDLTLLICLLNNCYVLDPQQEQCVTDIRIVRNEIAHFANDNDIDNITFSTMWGKVTNATIHLAMCISPSYSTEIQDKIKQLKERTLTQDESTSKMLQILTTMQSENVTRDERIECMELRIIDAISCINQRSTENPDHSGRVTRNQSSPENENNSGTVVRNQRPTEVHDNTDTCELVLEETQCKTVDQSNNVSCLDVDEAKYFKLFSDVQQLRMNGVTDTNDGMLYSLLVYVVLNGSSKENKIDIAMLLSIYKSIYKRTFPFETVSVKTCLATLVPQYLDKVDDKFTPCSITVVKAVIHCFGNECSECFVQNCSLYILLDYVVPIGTNIEDFHIEIDAYILTSVLIQRIKFNSDARSIGRYINKLAITHKNVETANVLIDTLEQSDAHFTPDCMVYLLDGLTKRGTDFLIFEKLEKLFNLFCRQIDKFGNTVFHFLVTRFSESSRFNAYLKFFCESNIVVMQLENNYNQTSIDFASYQGRYDVVANVMGNIENTESLIARILTMVKEGVDLLKRVNLSKSKETSNLYIGIETIPLGGIEDYENILDLIGVRKKVRKRVCDVGDKKEKNVVHADEKADHSSSSTDELSKTVGDGVLGLVTEIKMGLSAITKIPKLIKAIHQATNIEDDD